MEVEAKNAAKSKKRKIKRKTIEIKNDIGHFISASPLFKIVKDKAGLYFHNPEALNEEITQFYNKATREEGKKNLADMWQKVKELYEMLQDALHNKYKKLPKVKVVIGIAVILYVIMPTDMIPDVLPAFGFADDAALLAWFIKQAAKEIKHYEEWRAVQAQIPAC